MSACISKVWGDYANPNGYTNSKKIHAYFEGEFVKRNLSRAVVAAAVGPYRICNCTIEEEMLALLLNSLSRVEPLYQLEKEGGFKPGDSRGIAFAVERLSAGAQALRDMIVDAWFDSEETPIGAIQAGVHSITVVLNLVQPIVARWRFVNDTAELRLDPFARLRRFPHGNYCSTCS